MYDLSQQDSLNADDITQRIEELIDVVMDEDMNDYLPDADPADIAEFKMLRDFQKECEDTFSDWQWGEYIYSDSYFPTHARELFEEMGDVPTNQWPYRCIDWEQAANELQSDYTSVEINGVTFWGRS
jgi:antirestriction protein